MKIEVEIYEDQLEFLKRIQELPGLVESHIGKIPQSFPAGHDEIQRIKELCESLEFHWKRWVFQCITTKTEISSLFEGVGLERTYDNGYEV